MNFTHIYKLGLLLRARNIYKLRIFPNPSSTSHQDLEIICKNMSFCSWVKEEVYRDHFDAGIYVCIECGHKLFSSVSKYEHETPWPAFAKTISEKSVSKVPEEGRSNALKVSCGSCGNGLGHEFLKDGPDGTSSRF